MKNSLFLLAAALLPQFAAAAGGAEARNRALSLEAKGLEARAAELENECRGLEESIRVLDVAAELMDGTRAAPPRPRVRETLVYEDGAGAPVEFDATEAPVKDKNVWLKLKPGSRYRFECEAKTENLTGTATLKFGAYAPVEGRKTRWPACPDTGAGTFDWQRLAFEYEVPFGGRFMLIYGPKGGRGKAWFRNVRGYEVAEVDE